MNDKTFGIILKQQEYKENDALVTILTKEFGLCNFVCKGVLKQGSKNNGALFPFSCSEILFDYNENKTIFSLHNSHLVKIYKSIQTDLRKTAVANIFVELICSIFKEEEDIEDGYELVETCFSFLDNSDDLFLPLALFFATVLQQLGIAPEVDECSICENKIVSAISVEDGGFVCENCYSGKKENEMLLKQFRYVNKATYKDMEILSHYGPYSYEIVSYLYQFLENYLSIHLKSWRFLNDVLVLSIQK